MGRCRLLLGAILFISLALFGMSGLPAYSLCRGPNLDPQILKLSVLKSKWVARARDLKQKAPDDQFGRQDYENALAEVEGVITLFRSGLTRGGSPDPALAQAQFKKMELAVVVFDNYSALELGLAQPTAALGILSILSGVWDGILKFWKACGDQVTEESKRIDALLVEQRWPAWQDISK